MTQLEKIWMYVDAMESKTSLALKNDGSIVSITPELNPQDISKFVDSAKLKKLIIKELFDKDKVGKDDYKKALLLMKYIHKNTNPNTPKSVMDELKIRFEISTPRQRKTKTVKNTETVDNTENTETTNNTE